MDANSALKQQAEELRLRAVSAVDNLLQKGVDFELPGASALVGQYRERLLENKYKVLVVGEAKRGKSTFINALIGRDILPTDVDVATAQVFQVTRTPSEAYRLRFEDDSCQAIEAADLPRYGSQVVMEQDGTPRLDQIIRWIEVDVPASFIPDGISILDTPGLGALYAAHAQITQRYVPHADAVIFVLDSTQPVGQPELDFIHKLLEVTSSIFFIQTKIDLFRRDDWQAVQQRSEEILRKNFGEGPPDPRVWPISSTNLRKAGETGEDAYLMVSRHQELAAALQVFLFRVAGWARTADAAALALDYQSRGTQILTERLTALSEESKEKREQLRSAMQERKEAFDAEWGPNSGQCRELLSQFHRVAVIGQQQVRQALQPGGTLESDMRQRIDSVSSMAAAKSLGKDMTETLVSGATKLWCEVCTHATAQATTALQPLAVSVEQLAMIHDVLETVSPPKAGVVRVKGDGFGRKIGPTFQGLTMGGAIGGFGSTLATAFLVSAGIAAPWLGPAIIIGGALWGIRQGWSSGSERELTRVRDQLMKNLAKIMLQVRSYFLEVDIASGRLAVVEEHFALFESQFKEAVSTVARRASEQADAELKRLADNARLDDEQRKARARLTQEQSGEWNKLGGRLKDLAVGLTALDAALQTSASG